MSAVELMNISKQFNIVASISGLHINIGGENKCKWVYRHGDIWLEVGLCLDKTVSINEFDWKFQQRPNNRVDSG